MSYPPQPQPFVREATHPVWLRTRVDYSPNARPIRSSMPYPSQEKAFEDAAIWAKAGYVSEITYMDRNRGEHVRQIVGAEVNMVRRSDGTTVRIVRIVMTETRSSFRS